LLDCARNETFYSSEFEISARKPVQESVLETLDVVYKPIASVDHSDLEYLIPAYNERYIDPDIKVYVRGKLIKIDGTAIDEKEFTSVTNNFLHSLFSQCTVSLNGTTITQAIELYNYRSLLETLLTYDNDAATKHLRNAMWIMDDGNMVACDPTSVDSSNNKWFMTRCSLTKKNQEIEFYGRVHTDFCNVPAYLLLGVRVQIKFTKAKAGFYLMNKDAESKTVYQFLDAQLLVKRVRPNPTIPLAHKTEHTSSPSKKIYVSLPITTGAPHVQPWTFLGLTFIYGPRHCLSRFLSRVGEGMVKP